MKYVELLRAVEWANMRWKISVSYEQHSTHFAILTSSTKSPEIAFLDLRLSYSVISVPNHVCRKKPMFPMALDALVDVMTAK